AARRAALGEHLGPRRPLAARPPRRRPEVLHPPPVPRSALTSVHLDPANRAGLVIGEGPTRRPRERRVGPTRPASRPARRRRQRAASTTTSVVSPVALVKSAHSPSRRRTWARPARTVGQVVTPERWRSARART